MLSDLARAPALRWALPALLAALGLWRLAAAFRLHPPLGLGWDFAVLCDAVHVLHRHGDPYLVANLPHHTFSYPYLPTVAWVVSPVCPISHDGSIVFALIWLAMLALTAGGMARGLGCSWGQSALLAVAALGAFDAGRWAVLTGNAAILELPFVAAAIVAWHRGRTRLAGAALGAMATIKMLPVVLLLAFPLLLPWRRAAAAVATGLAVFVPVVALGFWLAAPYGHDYLRVLTGDIPGQHSPFAETMLGAADPNLPDFLARLTVAAGLAHRGPSITAMALLLFAAGLALPRLRARPGTAAFCVTLLLLSLTLFRLKPYAFWSLTLMALGATVEAGAIRPARLAAVLGGLVVAAAFVVLPGGVGAVFLDYAQLVALLFAVLVLLVGVAGRYAGEAASSRSIGSQA